MQPLHLADDALTRVLEGVKYLPPNPAFYQVNFDNLEADEFDYYAHNEKLVMQPDGSMVKQASIQGAKPFSSFLPCSHTAPPSAFARHPMPCAPIPPRLCFARCEAPCEDTGH